MNVYALNHRRNRTLVFAFLSGVAALAAPKLAQACMPYGDIAIHWQQLGGASGVMGPCVDDEHDDGIGGRIETFQQGYIEWSPTMGARATYGAIGHAWMTRYGGPPWGEVASDEYNVSDSVGRMNTFWYAPLSVRQYLVWNPGGYGLSSCYANADHVCEVYGRISEVWVIHNDLGDIGSPVDEEYDDGEGHRRQDFQKMYITWNKATAKTCVYYNYSTSLYWADGPC